MVPPHILLPVFDVIVALGVTLVLTVMVITLLFAVAGLGQLKLLVIPQETVLPSAKLDVM